MVWLGSAAQRPRRRGIRGALSRTRCSDLLDLAPVLASASIATESMAGLSIEWLTRRQSTTAGQDDCRRHLHYALANNRSITELDLVVRRCYHSEKLARTGHMDRLLICECDSTTTLEMLDSRRSSTASPAILMAGSRPCTWRYDIGHRKPESRGRPLTHSLERHDRVNDRTQNNAIGPRGVQALARRARVLHTLTRIGLSVGRRNAAASDGSLQRLHSRSSL